MALWQQRLLANDPQASLNTSSFLYNLGAAFVSNTADFGQYLVNTAPGMTLAGSSGDQLKAKAADYGYKDTSGQKATYDLVFSIQTPQYSAILIPAQTEVSTTGNGVSTIPVTATTDGDASILPGYLNTNSDQIETITVNGSPTGGTFTLTHGGQTTAAITYDGTASGTAANIQTALTALSTVGTSDITGLSNALVDGISATEFTVEWRQALGGTVFPVMTHADSLTGGTSPSLSISITQASVPTVTATATAVGSAGNVNPNTLVYINSGIAGVSVTNPLQGTGSAYGYLTAGADPDDDTAVRKFTNAALSPTYGASNYAAAAETVDGVFDAYCYDPQDGTGTVTLYWSDVDGNSNTYGTTPSCYNANGQGTLQIAVNDVLQGNLKVTYTGFLITTVTLAATYSCSSSIASSVIEPQIQAEMAAFVQQLTHGEAVVPSLMFQYVQQQLGFILTYFNVTVTPSSAATPVVPATLTSTTTLYRFTASPSTITLTRQ